MKVKTLKTILVLTAFFGLAFLLVCCSKDDSDKTNDLAGNWIIVHSEGYERDKSADINYEWDKEESIPFALNADGTTDMDGEGRWTFTGKKLTFIYEYEGGIEKDVYDVLTLKPDLLILEQREKDGDQEYYAKLTCKRDVIGKERFDVERAAGTWRHSYTSFHYKEIRFYKEADNPNQYLMAYKEIQDGQEISSASGSALFQKDGKGYIYWDQGNVYDQTLKIVIQKLTKDEFVFTYQDSGKSKTAKLEKAQ